MDFVEGVLSILGGAVRVLFELLEAMDFVDLLGWWILYLIPAPLWAAGAYTAFGGAAHGTRALTAGAVGFIAGIASTVAWARKGETAGYVVWGGAVSGFIMVLVHAYRASPT